MRDISDVVLKYINGTEHVENGQRIYHGWEKGDLTSEKAKEVFRRKPYYLIDKEDNKHEKKD